MQTDKIERMRRSLTERIYLMECLAVNDKDKNKLSRGYMVMGASGNLYKVTICSEPQCTCLDYKVRHKRCKHIFFVLIRIMHTKHDTREVYDDDELKEMFESIPEITKNLIPQEDIQNSYKSLQEKEAMEKNKDKDGKVKQRGMDDICPICLDDLKDTVVDYCKYQCGKTIHKECFKMWCKKNNNKCVFCRGDWYKNTFGPNQYINLLANINTNADTITNADTKTNAANTTTNADTITNADTNANADTKTNTVADIKTNTNADAKTNTNDNPTKDNN